MEEDCRNWSLAQWTQMFDELYGARNVKKSNQDLWFHFFEELGELSKALRKSWISPRENKGKLNGVLVNIADLFAWYSAFSKRYGDIEDFLWFKFPNVCPYCVVEENCACISQPKSNNEEKELKLAELRNNTENKPKTMYDWQEMFRRIYGAVNKSHVLPTLAWHLNEEAGEVSRAFRLLNKALKNNKDAEDKRKDLENEIADVFAWLSALTIKCEDFTGEELRLDDIIWQRYPNKCPHCLYKPCDENCYKNGK